MRSNEVPKGSFDFVVVGAGIAGASVAYELSRVFRVLLVEAEPQPGFHSTGRSAALFSEIYGGTEIRALSRASRSFFAAPPNDFVEVPLVHPRSSLFLAMTGRGDALQEWRTDPHIAAGTRLMTAAEAVERVSILRPDQIELAAFEPDAQDIDIDALLQAYLRGFRATGGTLTCNTSVQTLRRSSSGWSIGFPGGHVETTVVINAAGAWADEIGRLAGAAPIGLVPKRRTAIMIASPPDRLVDLWPLVIDFDETFYFKPDAGQLLISPADETPLEPCDVYPEEIDIATAAYRFEQATNHRITHIRHEWAGLRSFVDDKVPVIGFDERQEGFFWLAGQGGYGIQTAPAAARLSAALAQGRAAPPDIEDQGLDVRRLSPSRLTAS